MLVAMDLDLRLPHRVTKTEAHRGTRLHTPAQVRRWEFQRGYPRPMHRVFHASAISHGRACPYHRVDDCSKVAVPYAPGGRTRLGGRVSPASIPATQAPLWQRS